MVATVLRLRYRILGNILSRNPWQLVGFCLGVLSALWLLALVAFAMIALAGLGDASVSRMVVVLGGSALVAGWVIGPLLIAGMDTTVDAGRLAPFPLTRRQVMLALTGTGATGVPGITTTLAALITAIVWWRSPVALLVAVPCALLGALVCVIAGRLAGTLSASLGGNRRGRELVGTLALGLVIMAGPILSAVAVGVGAAVDAVDRVALAADVLGWTPIGAAWAVPADLAAGTWASALVKVLIAVATLAGLWLIWSRALAVGVVAPRHRVARAADPGRLGLFGLMPTGGVGATWARSLTAWLRDPRYLRQLIFVPLFPALFAFTGGLREGPFVASAVIVAFVLSITGYTDISYDGTAFASVLSTGVRGWQDRLGRLLGAATVGIPAVVLVAIVTLVIADAVALLPGVLGAALGILLAGYAVSAVSSALIVSPVSAPGDSPFKTVPGQTFLNGLLVFVVMAGVLVLAAPSLITTVIGLVTGTVQLGWIALAIAVVVGSAAITGGVIVGGRTLERTGPSLLLRIKAFPTG